MKIGFILTWKTGLALVAAGVLMALVVGWSGLVSISASSGHYSPVSWFLHWTMRNAVATQALSVEVPEGLDLADPTLVRRAAGHFATECAFCHGAPGIAQSPTTAAMMPPPPRLEGQVGRWSDPELFWIVQHGIKYSGMPAWVSQERPDEAWAMAAFLRALPSLSPADYADMALGGTGTTLLPPTGVSTALSAVGDIALQDCARCHGRDGRGVVTPGGARIGAIPIIAGQPEGYLLETLRAYAAGTRQSGYMQGPARRYEDAVLKDLARHYASEPARNPAIAPTPPSGPAAAIDTAVTAAAGSDLTRSRMALARVVPDTAAYGAPYDQAGLVDLGRRLATQGLPDRKLPACDSCHGTAPSQTASAERALYPFLAGQPDWYLATHLKLWRDGKRGGTSRSHVMDKIAIHLTDEQIAAVSAWYATQPAGRQ
ncbi:cytochrome c [Aureimonas sp. SA4125]|uniref:c-type cytochrome n=1 Tax=Aureimonas sp. SA4125 TaxID=2826993 RepID=UPI001CC58A79|nr:c-type cytochrome [Aureimonas sp. SA4125]BDA83018.1 cytochrome c [Aureimonas sp. SA4125]